MAQGYETVFPKKIVINMTAEMFEAMTLQARIERRSRNEVLRKIIEDYLAASASKPAE